MASSKILLHTCCAPCTTYVYQKLLAHGFTVEGLFYNPNIRPQEEYVRRRETMEKYASAVGLKVIYDSIKEPANELRGSLVETETFSLRFPLKPEDCENCYAVRLHKTAEQAAKLGFDFFSTTLFISPYQKHDLLKAVGEKIALEIGVKFYYNDFRPGFSESRQMAKAMNLYRQKYCGCKT